MVMSPGRTDRGAKRLPATERRQQLLDVALRLFATKGYTATTMDDIADAAGVTKPLLYQHFDSKRALYMELVEAVASAMRAAIGDATSRATSPRQQVEGGFSAYFELVVSQAHAFQLLFGSNTPEDDETALMLRHVEDVMAESVATLIDAGLDDDHRLLLAHAVVGMAEGASRYLLSRVSTAGEAGDDHGAPLAIGEGPGPGLPDAPAAASPTPAGGPGPTSSSTHPADDPGTSAEVIARLASRLADLAWAGLRSVRRD